MLIMRRIDSNDSNHSSKFTILIVVAFIKNEHERQRQQARCSFTNPTYFVLGVNVKLWRVEINNIIRVAYIRMWLGLQTLNMCGMSMILK